MDLLSRLPAMLSPDQTPQSTTLTIAATAAATTTVLLLATSLLRRQRRPAVLPSPLKTLLPRLTPSQQADLLYPPDFFPGARDVPTPYGSMRCYEFGDPSGRKVLLLHGISTSCMTLSHLARGLAARGCRVMLLDLFGRGFSDGVGDLPFDERLFVSQALCALASSELAWTGGSLREDDDDERLGFHLVGYSLGGGIAVHLATAFPGMVRTLVLLAPAGMIREENFGTAVRLVFRSGWVPEALLEIITRWRLRRPIAESAKRKPKVAGAGASASETTATAAAAAARPHLHLPGDKTVDAAVTSEIADSPAADQAEPNALQRRVLAFVNWQVANHAGFVTAFMSTLRHAPMLGQREAWSRLAARRPRTTCLIFGVGDEIVSEEDYREDALPLVGGEDHVVWARPVDGKHDFPMVHPEETLRRIYDFWGWD